jgi:thiamine pyrophosphate-dependent acetolactate synthase large subunit-like protein
VDGDPTLDDVVEGRVVVLAGPGVVDGGAVEGLRTFAAAGTLGVANTWGAKGVFAWDSPHHLGTCGLQARDFELLGFAEAETIVTTGLSEAESPRERYALAPTIDVRPSDLAASAGHVRASSSPRNELYPRLAAVAQPGYAATKVPLHPARAVADLGAVLPAGGLLVAEPGLAGLWVARTFPTPALAPGAPRRVSVRARHAQGASVRDAVVAARSGRPAIFVTTIEPDAPTRAELDRAHAAGIDLVVVVWGDAGRLRTVDDHAARLHEALVTSGVTRVDVPVALEDTELLVEAAGPVVAWGGLTHRSGETR